MKLHNLLITGLCMLLAIVAWGQPKPPLTFDKKVHDFGTIKEDGGLVSTRFSFQNTSSSTAKITNVIVSCGCTSPTWTKEDLAPKDTGNILITFDPMDRPGHFEKYIRVEFKTGSEVVIKIHGMVTPRPEGPRDWYPFFVGELWFKQSNMFVGGAYNDTITTFRNTVYNPSNEAITIDWSKSQLPGAFVTIDAKGKQTIAPKDSASFTMTYDATARNDWGYVSDTIRLVTDDASMPEKILMASILIKERFDENSANPTFNIDKDDYAFGDIAYGSKTSVTFTVTNTGDAPLYIRKVKSNCSCLSATFSKEAIPPGESAELVAHLNTGDHMGWMRKMLTVITNDPKADFKNLIIKAEVKPPTTKSSRE